MVGLLLSSEMIGLLLSFYDLLFELQFFMHPIADVSTNKCRAFFPFAEEQKILEIEIVYAREKGKPTSGNSFVLFFYAFWRGGGKTQVQHTSREWSKKYA